MEKGTREQNIKRIINMEDRIGQCNRCVSLSRCMRKPSLGKGDLEPGVFLVFECDSYFTSDMEKLIQLRNWFKKHFETERVYHSFQVRCQPKACSARQSASCFIDGKLLDKDRVCILTGKICEGIAIKPSTEETMNCLPFLLEELKILRPDYVVLFGDRVSSFIIKAIGIYEPVNANECYEYDGIKYLTTIEENIFLQEDVEKLALLRT